MSGGGSGDRAGPRGVWVLGAVRMALVFTLRAVRHPGKVIRFDACLRGKTRPHVASLVAVYFPPVHRCGN